MNKFSQKSIEKLKYYVYALKDPSNNEVFYIGKGKDNRIFDHVVEDINLEKAKIAKILEIQSKGNEVIREIIHFGLSENEALAAEATLINYVGINNLTNQVVGHKSEGKYLVDTFEKIYAAESVEIKHNVMLIKITQYTNEFKDNEVYEQVRGYWKISLGSAKKVDYIFAIYKGLIKGIYVPQKWYRVDLKIENHDAPREFELKQGDNHGRVYFKGIKADQLILDYYLNKDVSYKIKKTQNPISYHLV
jgi:hypothetical protein